MKHYMNEEEKTILIELDFSELSQIKNQLFDGWMYWDREASKDDRDKDAKLVADSNMETYKIIRTIWNKLQFGKEEL